MKPVQATTTTVNIGNDWYSNSASNNCGSPCVTNIGVGDTVHWVWIGTHQHSTTSDAGSSEVWDSGEHGMGNTFDLTFNTPGTYNYHCPSTPACTAGSSSALRRRRPTPIRLQSHAHRRP